MPGTQPATVLRAVHLARTMDLVARQTHGPGDRPRFASSQDCLLRSQTDADQGRGHVWLAAVFFCCLPVRSFFCQLSGCISSTLTSATHYSPPSPITVNGESGGRHPPFATESLQAKMFSAACFKRSFCAPPAQYSHGPCSGTSTPSAIARKCATSHRNSTGDSASPFSRIPHAGHIPQRDCKRQDEHRVVRVRFFSRACRRKLSQPSFKLVFRRSYVSCCAITQIPTRPQGSMAHELMPPPQVYSVSSIPSPPHCAHNRARERPVLRRHFGRAHLHSNHLLGR